jgi:hypothetical protein
MDYMTKAGATHLAARITEAWARAGHAVPAEVRGVPGSDGHIAYYVVDMPTLSGGLPR